MNRRNVIFVAHRPSNGGRLLAQTLGCRYTSNPSARLKRSTELIVHWGTRAFSTLGAERLNNHVSNVSNKRIFAGLLRDMPNTLEWTGTPVFDGETLWLQRTILNGHSGQGIVMCRSRTDIHASSYHLFSKYFPKTHEFRFHMFKGRCIDVVQKKKRNGIEANSEVRTYDNGWVFAHNDLALGAEDIQSITDRLTQHMNILRQDFGACDVLCIIENGQLVDWKLCEVNSAPGLASPTTIQKYVEAFGTYIDERD